MHWTLWLSSFWKKHNIVRCILSFYLNIRRTCISIPELSVPTNHIHICNVSVPMIIIKLAPMPILHVLWSSSSYWRGGSVIRPTTTTVGTSSHRNQVLPWTHVVVGSQCQWLIVSFNCCSSSYTIIWIMASTPSAPKRLCLTKIETVNTFENWGQNLVYTLS